MNTKPDEKRSVPGSMQSHFWIFFGSIWLLVGLPFVLLAGYFVVQERQLARNGQVVQAMVLTKDIGRSGDRINRSVTYRFSTTAGRTLEGRSEVSEQIWNGVTERGPVDVAYLPHRPSLNAVVGATKLTLLLIFSFVGGLLSIAGGAIVTVSLRNARMRRRLLTSGIRAAATVADVTPMKLRVNGRTQWRVKYEYRDFQSRPHQQSLYLDADEARLWKPGDTGEVLFDPDRPDRAVWMGKPDGVAP